MSLSDKIVMAEDHYYEGIGWCVRTEDVKEFIKERDKLLQDYLEGKIPLIIFLKRKDELAGEELK